MSRTLLLALVLAGALCCVGCTHTAGFVIKDVTQRSDGRIAVEQCELETTFFLWANPPKLERCETKLVSAAPHVAAGSAQDDERVRVGR